MRALLLLLAPLLFSGFAQASETGAEEYEEVVTITPEVPKKRIIEGLDLPLGDIPVEAVGNKRFIEIKGEFIQPLWSLMWENKVLVDDPLKPAFSFRVQLTHPSMRITLTAVSADGDILYERFLLKFRVKEKPPSRLHFAVSSGLSYISYHETRIPDFKMTAITAKAISQYILSPGKFDVMVGGFATVIPITTSRTDNIWPRFIGINGRFGYILPFIKHPWRLSFNTGLYYTTMQVQSNRFGFSNMIGPQIFLVGDRFLDLKNRATAYFKFSPVAKSLSFSLFDLGNRELAVGGGWIHILPNQHPLSVMTDFSMFTMQFGRVKLAYESFSLSVGYGL